MEKKGRCGVSIEKGEGMVVQLVRASERLNYRGASR